MADVTINATVVATGNEACGDGRCVVFQTDLVGYAFYINANADFVYRKTTNGGSSWGSEVNIFTHATQTCEMFCIWARKWTSSSFATNAVIDTYYTVGDGAARVCNARTLTMGTDALGTQTSIGVGGTNPITVNTSHMSATVANNGNLFVAGYYDSTSDINFFRRFTTSWQSRTTPIETISDMFWLFPSNDSGNTDDVIIIYWDVSADELSRKLHNDTSNSNSETSIQTAMVETLRSNIVSQCAGAVRYSDGLIVLVAWENLDVAASSRLRCWFVGYNSITAKTTIVGPQDDMGGCSVFIDQNNDDIYVMQMGLADGSEAILGTGVKIYYYKSTDDASTWSSQTAYSEDAADDFRLVSVDMCAQSGRFYGVWFDDDDNDLFGGFTNSIAISPPVNLDVATAAAIQVINHVYDAHPSSNTHTIPGAAVGTGTTPLLLSVLTWTNQPQSPPSGGGVTWTLREQIFINSQAYLSVYLGIGTRDASDISVTGGGTAFLQLCLDELIDANPTTPIVQDEIATATSGEPADTLAAFADAGNDTYVCGVGQPGVPESGYRAIFLQSGSGPIYTSMWSALNGGNDTSPSFDAASGSTWAMYSAEINMVAAVLGEQDVSTAAALSTTNTRDQASAGAVSTTNERSQNTAAALARTELQSVASAAALARTEVQNVASAAALNAPAIQSALTAGSISRIEARDAASAAALATTNVQSVATAASIEVVSSANVDVASAASTSTTNAISAATAAAVARTLTLDALTAAAVARTELRDVASAAALTRTELRDVLSAAALIAPAIREVASAAAVATTNSRDVASQAAVTLTGTRNVLSAASIILTGIASVPSAAALSTTNLQSVSSAAALNAPGVQNVATQAALTRTEQRDVASAGALSRTEQRDVLTAAAISVTAFPSINVATAASLTASGVVNVATNTNLSRTEQRDAATAGAVALTALRNVLSAAALSALASQDAFTQAAVARTEARSQPTQAAISRTVMMSVPTAASLSLLAVQNVPSAASLAMQATRDALTAAAIASPTLILVPTVAAVSVLATRDVQSVAAISTAIGNLATEEFRADLYRRTMQMRENNRLLREAAMKGDPARYAQLQTKMEPLTREPGWDPEREIEEPPLPGNDAARRRLEANFAPLRRDEGWDPDRWVDDDA